MPADAAASSPGVTDLQRRIDELSAENARLHAEQREALEQQTATAEVLQVINASPGDLAPVFEAILAKAHALCRVTHGSLQLYDGEKFRAVALHDVPEALAKRLLEGYVPGPSLRGLIDGADFHHTLDITALDDPMARVTAEGGIRTLLRVPLRKDGRLLGQIVSSRKEVRPFTEKEIALLRGFATQAVIAIENARLLDEIRRRTDDLTQSLEYQTATSDVLKVISRSTFDLQPVLDTLVETAARLCAADTAHVVIRDDQAYRPAATFGYEADFDAFVRGLSFSPGRDTTVGRVLLDGQTVHIEDAATDPEYSNLESVRRGAHTQLGVPLIRESELVGVIVLVRLRVEPFSERQIELVSTFADQAVIAMENARLLNAQREALEQQQATSERQIATADILRVIASSPSDVQPVFDAIAERSNRLIGGLSTAVYRLADDDVLHLMALTPVDPEADAALKALHPRPLSTPQLRDMIRAGKVHRTSDTEIELRDNPAGLAVARLRGFRSRVLVPLVQDGETIGLIGVTRAEPGLIADEHVELLKTFADQAVIAIRNARLFNELREALEQQTATADILRVISQSPTDVSPVLAAVAKAALQFCDARDALVLLRDGDNWFAAAHEGPIAALVGTRPLTRHTAPGRAMLDGEVVQIRDVQSDEGEEFPEAREIGARHGFRSALAAPLMRDDVAIGALSLRRAEPGAFTPNQVELLKSFAAQAVIAIENVRLFTELREALDQQTATAEILRVISQSPNDVGPVLTAVTKAALKFCGARDVIVALRDGDSWFTAAHEGPIETPSGASHRLTRGTAPGRAILDARVVEIEDYQATHPDEFPEGREISAR